ncbi:MAG: YegS/Rv2252/BmrU family lipid kinase [Ferruginibacter sp.]
MSSSSVQRKIIYFINPVSGTKTKDPLLVLIEKKTTAAQIPFEILHTNAAGDYNYLKEKISKEQITDIVICGGDGTVNQVAYALFGVNINIGIVPMGSGNGLAFAAGIPKNSGKALDVIFKNSAILIDSFLINKKFSCMLCGLGFDAQVAHDFAKQKKRGLATYVKQSIKNFVSAKPFPFSIETENKTFDCDAWFISIANSNQFGNNFTIAPKASLCDGLLDIVVVKKMNKLLLVWKVLQQIRNGKIRNEMSRDFEKSRILYFHTKKITIHNLQAAPLHIDGDPATTADKFEIEIIPAAFKLIMP